MKLNVIDNGWRSHAALLERTCRQRIPLADGETLQIELGVDASLGSAESYCISRCASGWRIVGSDEAGLYFGIGKFLHTARWSEDDFVPSPPSGVVTPACSFRAIYFAVHLHNWYASASAAELGQYIEELMLWGYNTAVLILPVIDLFSFDSEAAHEVIGKCREIYQLARQRGMRVGIIICPNQGLRSMPQKWAAEPPFDPERTRGNAGMNVCPAKEGAVDYLRSVWLEMLRPFADIGLDYLVTWPYDEGGCGCADCLPWGGRGYADLVRLLDEEARQIYPAIKTIVSTWTFDRPEGQGEFDLLYRRLGEDLEKISYVMVDAHGDYPRYPLEHERVRPVVNFPEISMWRLFPWGGYGANPLPARFHRIWNSAKSILDGGMPYSEGMYEDISKIQFVGYYWEPDRSWQDILAEYISYEVSPDAVEQVLSMVELIERNHVAVGEAREPDPALAAEGARIAREVDAHLGARARAAWRWRLLYIRAILDGKRYAYYARAGMHGEADLKEFRYFSSDYLADDAEAQSLLQELRVLYHCVPFNGRNQHTLAFAGEATRLGNGDTLADYRRRIAEAKK